MPLAGAARTLASHAADLCASCECARDRQLYWQRCSAGTKDSRNQRDPDEHHDANTHHGAAGRHFGAAGY